MPSYRFRPPWWATLGLLPLLLPMMAAGFWQLDKGLAKAGLAEQMQQPASAALTLRRETPAPSRRGAQPAQARGAYEPQRQLRLDNQSHARQPGYRVWTPLRLSAEDGGGLVMVDRGWRPRTQLDEALSVDAGPRTLRGLWRPLPEPGLRLGDSACAAAPAWPLTVQYPTAAELACLYGEPVADGLLLLDPAEPEGYVREWSPVREVPASRHYGYAAQWFAFSATLLFFYIKLNLKRLP